MFTFHRKVPLWIAVSIPLALAGCGGGDDSAGGDTAQADAPAVTIQNPGVVTGTVAFTGTAPALEPIDMRDEPDCAAEHSDPPVQETVVVNDNGTLRNVFVWVREGLDQPAPEETETRVLDQNGCEYEPRIMGVQAGHDFTIRNSDPVLHNINAQPSANRGFNFGQPQEGMESQRSFASQEVMVPVQCDVHSWMTAYIGVVDHPYYAVTGEDGSFTIENLPPGDYVLEAWHEVYGTQTASVTVPPDGTVETSFTFTGDAAASAHQHGAYSDHLALAGMAGVD